MFGVPEVHGVKNTLGTPGTTHLGTFLYIWQILSFMLIRIYNENPNSGHIRQVVDLLEAGGIIIYPTDTVYAMGCDIQATKSIERIARFKG